jgi:hypothetical protein
MQHARADFAGMNSGKMQSLIDDLKTAQHTIAGFAGEFSAPLAAQGISTATVHQAAHWTADQVSSLGERLKELREHERTTPDVPGGPTPAAPAGTTPSAANPGTGGGTAPGGSTPGGNAPGGNAPGGNAPGGSGDPAGAATLPVPAPPPPAHAAAAPVSAAPASAAHATAAHEAAQSARHVSQAAQQGQSLPDRVWHDIERYASEPQFAAAFLAAVGAAGLTALVASIAESRKKDKRAKEASRRQALLDELTRSAGEHEDPAEPAASPGQKAGLSLARPPSGDAPGHGHAQEPGGQPEAGPQPRDAPRLSLVAAATGPEGSPATRVPPPSGES